MERIRVQLSVPKEIMDEIDKEISETYSTRTAWLLKAAINELKRKKQNIKKVIDLDI